MDSRTVRRFLAAIKEIRRAALVEDTPDKGTTPGVRISGDVLSVVAIIEDDFVCTTVVCIKIR